MKFSIITPHYNSYNLMQNYFNSLEKQTYRNFEVIIIDDCSTDGSYEKILKYQKKSNLNLTILRTKKNMGPGVARNYGLKKVKGDYITFIDSDDYIENTCLSEIASVLEKNEFDCLIFDYYRHFKGKKQYGTSIPNFEDGIISKKDAIANITGSTWCKVYKKQIIHEHEITFPSLMRFEDMAFNKLAISKCDNIYYYKKPFYNYINHKGSIVHSEKYQNISYAIDAFKIVEKNLEDEYKHECEAIFTREVLYSTVLLLAATKVKQRNIISHINKLETRYPNWYENNYIKNFSNHQKLALKLIKYKFISGLRLITMLRKLLK